MYQPLNLYYSSIEPVTGQDIHSPAGLHPCGLYHQTCTNLLCCTLCHVLLTLSAGLHHVQNAYKDLGLNIKTTDFNMMCKDLGIQGLYPCALSLSGIDAHSGLDMYTWALLCLEHKCGCIFTFEGAMCRHLHAHYVVNVS